ncbi:sensor domain-containing protein [Mycobacterium sp.]|uniref:sensor domain-containing protein n=1 Tax=Mycobacterium sp. TaxID=1785 RepID=UPI002CB795E7|nr:sensor domain-containing protein [Mycobacterium sp.]HTY33563.1 sensor domain-containing protein [Mycobacterium sp.]
MRQRLTVLVLAGVSGLAVGCSTVVGGKAVPADHSGPLPQNPVAVAALDGLLLDAGQINTALNAASMKVGFSAKGMWDWSSSISDKDCLPLDGPAQDNVYAGSGWTAIRGQRLDDSVDDSKTRNHYAIQAVVAYPSARDANAFYDSSAQSWSACANRRFSDLPEGKPPVVWTVAGINKVSGTLSTSEVQEGGDGWSCQRALTVRNNVAIDVLACAAPLAAGPAVDIAEQIAAKVARQ